MNPLQAVLWKDNTNVVRNNTTVINHTNTECGTKNILHEKQILIY